MRAVWLAWWHLARVGGQADVLALARVRDRLLQRLLAEGLNKERDLPYFLRTAGEQNSERMRLVRERALRVHRLVEKWHAGEDVKVNKPYVDLMFAFGLAKLGRGDGRPRPDERQARQQLLEPVGPKGGPDPAHEFLAKAFAWRIENALQGKPHTGPLPPEHDGPAGHHRRGAEHQAGKRYIVDRLRQQSWILEPQERWTPTAAEKSSNDLQTALDEVGEREGPGSSGADNSETRPLEPNPR